MPDKHCTTKNCDVTFNNHTKQFLMAEKKSLYVHNVHALKKELNYYGSLVYSYTVCDSHQCKLCNKTVTKYCVTNTYKTRYNWQAIPNIYDPLGKDIFVHIISREVLN